MGNYILKKDEILLFEGEAANVNSNGAWHVQLTTKALVFSKEKKVGKAFHKTLETFVDVVNLDEIKIYNSAPQVKQKSEEVTVQTTRGNVVISFDGIIMARKFVSKLLEAVTGHTTVKRGLTKVNRSVNMVNDSLGFDAIGAVKSVVTNGLGGTLIDGIKDKKGIKEMALDIVADGAKGFAHKTLSDKSNAPKEIAAISDNKMSVDEQIETLKKLKQLLDSGILTQEEFDAKKRDVLGL